MVSAVVPVILVYNVLHADAWINVIGGGGQTFLAPEKKICTSVGAHMSLCCLGLLLSINRGDIRM